MQKYSIGVVTYIRRFEQYFVPLVGRLEAIFPGVEKNFVLNGFYNKQEQQAYLVKAQEFLSKYSPHSVVAYESHHGLSHCWNQLIINSTTEKVLIMNDDVVINKLFKLCLDLQVGDRAVATINGSWSHFIMSKAVIKKIGWFDERFVGVGQEDGDYALRIALAEGKSVMPNSHVNNIFCFGLKNLVAKNPDPGWKNFSATINQNKYAAVNAEVFKKKWDMVDSPRSGYVYAWDAHYFGIKPGMDTPNFYPDMHFS